MNFGRGKNKQLLEQQIKERKWPRIGHEVRKRHCAIAWHAQSWKCQGTKSGVDQEQPGERTELGRQ